MVMMMNEATRMPVSSSSKHAGTMNMCSTRNKNAIGGRMSIQHVHGTRRNTQVRCRYGGAAGVFTVTNRSSGGGGSGGTGAGYSKQNKAMKVNVRAIIANPPSPNIASGTEGTPALRTRPVRAVQQLQRLLEPSVERSTPLAYEIVAGSLVKWSENSSSSPSVPCCVLLHGMLGNRKNLMQLAKRLSDAFPAWMILLVDLRCHGDSSLDHRTVRQSGEHDLPQAARDVLQTLSILGVYPRIVIGHSFGGKVALSMAKQLGARALPAPTHMWILDTVPGPARPNFGTGQGDQPARLINYICASARTKPMRSRSELVKNLVASGFSQDIAMWMTTNVKENVEKGTLDWMYTLDGLSPMYASYEREDLWDVVEKPPIGLKLDFVEAERSSWHWHSISDRIVDNGGHHHILQNSGHWVHIDNPDGLLSMMSSSFFELAQD